MADPKMRKFADYLLANYRPPSQQGVIREGQVDPDSVPRMSSEDYRTGQFIRGLPAKLPPPVQVQTPAMKRQRAVAQALLQPTGTRAGRATRESMNPVGD